MNIGTGDERRSDRVVSPMEPAAGHAVETERIVAGLYGLGIISEENGHLERARTMFERADDLASRETGPDLSGALERLFHECHVEHLLGDETAFHRNVRRIRRNLSARQRHDIGTIPFPDQSARAEDFVARLREVARDDASILSSSRSQLVTDITGLDLCPLEPRLKIDLARGRYRLLMQNAPTVTGRVRVLAVHLPQPCRWLWPWYQPLLPRPLWESVAKELESFEFYRPLLRSVSFRLPAHEFRDIVDWVAVHVFGAISVPVPFRGAEHHVILGEAERPAEGERTRPGG